MRLSSGKISKGKRQRLLDDLGRCFVQAAVARLLKEQAIADGAQSSETT